MISKVAEEAAMKKYPPLVDEIAVVVPGGIKYEEQDIHKNARCYYAMGYDEGRKETIRKIKEMIDKKMGDNLSVDERLAGIYGFMAIEDHDILAMLDKLEEDNG